ncbi:transglycosylase SLT domain-containing protein [Niallia taxi]|uniref:phage tail tape measure protein n=1 Tax=Niallia taxi TaxID=2499688 RepID=UPI00203E01C3|nr:phage tail tape measure protein [Niallia taxi]MCM3216103.1 transglycosylase SLT domain-containing protein [Niallia taxi]
MEHIEGLSIGLDLDTVALNRGLTGLRERLRTVNSEMRANLSAFDRGDRSVASFEAKLNGLNRKMQVQEEITKAARQEYEKMVQQHGEGSREAEKAAATYNREVASLNTLRRNINNTQRDLAELREEQRRAESSWTQLGQSMDRAGETATNIGKKMSGAGLALTVGLTTPLLGAAAAAGEVAYEFGKASGVIQAELGISKDQAKELHGVAKDLWEDGFGDSIEGVSARIAGVTKSLGELSEVDLSYINAGIELFEERGWGDQQEALRAVKVMMEQFGMSATEAMDYLTKGFQDNLNFSGEFLDSVSEYSTYFSEFGMTADDMFAKFKAGAEGGAFQLDKVGDAMKEFSLRAKDGSKSSTEAYEALGLNAKEMTKQFNNGGEDAQKAFAKVIKALKKTKDEGDRNAASVGLFGTQFEDLGEKAFNAMLDASKGMKNVEGATKRASDALRDNLGTRATKVWRDFVGDMEPVGQVLIDVAEDILPKVADTIGDVTSAFSGFSPEAQRTILAVAGVGAAAGPTLMVLGSLTTGVGALFKIVSPLIPLLGSGAGLTGVLGALTGPVGLTSVALVGLGAGFLALDKDMDKPIIKSDIFAGKISESTQKVLNQYDKLKTDSNSLLWQMATGNEEVTDKHIANVVAKYQEMTKLILEQLDTRHQEERAKLVEQLNQNKTLSDEDKARTLADFDEHYSEERQQVTDNEAKKLEIVKGMQDQSEAERQAARERIAQIDLTNDQIMLENTAKTKDEYLTIQQNLKNEASIISAEKAAKYVADSKETTDKVVEEANKKANEEIAAITYGRDITGSISKEAADKLIADAERRRDSTVATAQDEHTSVVKAAKDQAGEHVGQVNWETGEILSGWDSMYNGVLSAVNWILDLFGKEPIAKKGTVKENGRQKLQRQNAQLEAAYADGTPSSGHPGGPAIVGEEGRELAFVPGKGVTLLGTRGPEYHSNLPIGTSVLPNKETEQMLKSYGFPGYANGIGDYFDLFLDGAGSVWDFAKDKFSLKDSLIPEWLNKHTGSPLSMIADLAKNWIKDTWDNWFGDMGSSSGGGAGVQQWAGIATKALMLTNQYSQSNLDRLLYQMQTESGGNAKAINLWDINAKRGTPSKGLMQVIDPTFKAYAMPGYNSDIYDPMSNILASIRYAVSRYGSLEKAYRGVGYETGGLINTAGMYQLAEGGWPEFVIPTDPSRRTDAMKLLALAGKQIQGNKRPNQLPNTAGSGNTDWSEMITRQDQQIALLQKQNDLLMRLILKPSEVIDNKALTKQISRNEAAEYSMLNYQLGGG